VETLNQLSADEKAQQDRWEKARLKASQKRYCLKNEG